jgi:formylglycine-generating enzyme required for sulfatase activity
MSDVFTRYELALEQLLARLGPQHPRAVEARTLQARLLENITAARRHGDTESRRAERSEIREALDLLAVASLDVPFNELVFTAPRPAELDAHQTFEPELVRIPAGAFLLGSDPQQDQDALENEQPQQRRHLPAYDIARTPVTNAQYAAFVRATEHRAPKHWPLGEPPKGLTDHPVINVSWYDALAYCRWLAEVTGRPYTLPTETQWEKAARGPDGRIYPWGNTFDLAKCNTEEADVGGTTPVGRYSPMGDSPYGCADMAGNVWEWCRTQWRASYQEAEDNDLEGEAPRVVRGGAFRRSAGRARCASRFRLLPRDDWGDHGFRVVVAVEEVTG